MAKLKKKKYINLDIDPGHQYMQLIKKDYLNSDKIGLKTVKRQAIFERKE